MELKVRMLVVMLKEGGQDEDTRLDGMIQIHNNGCFGRKIHIYDLK